MSFRHLFSPLLRRFCTHSETGAGGELDSSASSPKTRKMSLETNETRFLKSSSAIFSTADTGEAEAENHGRKMNLKSRLSADDLVNASSSSSGGRDSAEIVRRRRILTDVENEKTVNRLSGKNKVENNIMRLIIFFYRPTRLAVCLKVDLSGFWSKSHRQWK